MAVLKSGTTIGGSAAIHAGNMADHGIITTSNIGSYVSTNSVRSDQNAVTIQRHLDASTTWTNDALSLFLGWYGGKVVIGNNNESNHDNAAALGGNTIAITNTLYSFEQSNLYYDGSLKLYMGSDGTRNTGWAYHTDNSAGLHWPNNGWHVMPASSTDFRIYSGNASESALRFETSGTIRGYVYANSSNEIGFLNQDRSWKLRVYASGAVQSYGDFRAPIFYDSDDTGYYVDPNSTSTLYRVNSYYLSNPVDVANNHAYGMYLSSNLSTAYAIFREPGAWDHPYPDLRIAFHTGIKIGANASYEGVRFYTDYDMSSQVMSVNNGSDPLGGGNVYVNNSLQAGSSLRAPIFYDSNNTDYYVDPNSESRLYRINVGGGYHDLENTDAVIKFRNTATNHNYIVSNALAFDSWNQWIRYVDGYNTWRIGTYDAARESGTSVWRLAGRNRGGNSELNYIVAGPRGAWGESDRVILHNPYARYDGGSYNGDGTLYKIIDASNIGSQSVNYASSAGSVAWGNVSGRPSSLSEFTNNLTSFVNRIEFQYNSDRYSQAWRNTNTGAYWWVTTDYDKLGLHRNGDGDKFYFSNGGDFWSSTNGWLSTALSNKQDASTAINTSNWSSYAAPRAYVTDSYIDIYVFGDANTYYPVTIHAYNGGYGFQRYSVHRGYSWSAPWDPIGTGSHRGGLTFTFEWGGDIAWGGNDKSIRVIEFAEQYTQMVAGMQLAHCEGVVVWLRGGDAHYRIHGPGGRAQTVSINYEPWTSCASVTYEPRDYNSDTVSSEIYSRYPVRGSGNENIFVNNQAVIHSGNISSQSVSYASNAGSLDSLDSTDFMRNYGIPAGSDQYVNFRVIRNDNAGADAGMHIGYGNRDGGDTLIYGGGRTSASLYVYGGYAYAPGSFRAPIFYDSEDTGYYVDPNSESKLKKLWINNGGAGGVGWSTGLNMGDGSNYWNLIQDGGIARQRNFGTGGYDWFNNTASTQIMYLSNAGNLSVSGTLNVGSNATIAGNRFDIGGAEGQISFKDSSNVWTGNVGFSGDLGILSFPGRNVRITSGYNGTIELNTGTVDYNSGVISIPYGRLIVNNSYIETGTAVYSPIYYDGNDNSYYLNPNSSSRIRNLYVGDAESDWVDTGGWGTQFHVSNGPHSIIRVYARNEGIQTGMFSHVGGQSKVGSLTNHDFTIIRNYDTKMTFYTDYTYAEGYLQAASSLRAPIFYDSNDTGYYLDPNDTSNLNQLNTATRARWNMPRYWTNRTAYTGDEGYWTGTNGWGKNHGTWANAWQGGFSGWDIWGEGTDHPQGAGYVHAQGIVSGQHYATSNVGYGWMMVGAANATANRYWLRGKWDTSTSEWVEMITTGNIGSQSVDYANRAAYLPTLYNGDVRTNPQTYFGQSVGLRVAMTGSWSVWSDTLWINGYSGGDVKSMCALHFLRNGQPRFAISTQNHDGDSYGEYYEVVTSYNIGNQSVNYANYSGGVSGNQGSTFGLNDTKLYLRTNGDNNHYLWNAGDDWEELNAYEGTGFRITSNQGGTGILYVYGASNGGYTYSPYSFRAPIFYDSENTGYYLDPASRSNLYTLTLSGAGHFYPNSWIEFSGYYGLYSPNNGAHFYPNNGTYGAWRIAGSRDGYNGLEFDSSNGQVSLMVRTSSNITGFHNNSYGWQFYWEGGTLYCYKNSYGGGTSAVVLDSSNWSNYISAGGGMVQGNEFSAELNSSKLNIFNDNFTEEPVVLQMNGNDVIEYDRMNYVTIFKGRGTSSWQMELTESIIKFTADYGGWAPLACEYVEQVSDINLKHYISTIQNPIEKVKQLRGVDFLWKNNNQPSIGFIAQEVEEVLPVAVGNVDGTKTIDYSKIIPVLTEAIKEQQTIIEQLMARIEALENK